MNYDTYDEGQLRTARFQWQTNYREISREYDRASRLRDKSMRDEQLESARFRLNQAQEEITKIENALANLRRGQMNKRRARLAEIRAGKTFLSTERSVVGAGDSGSVASRSFTFAFGGKSMRATLWQTSIATQES